MCELKHADPLRQHLSRLCLEVMTQTPEDVSFFDAAFASPVDLNA